MRRLLFPVLLGFSLAACGSDSSTPAPSPTPTRVQVAGIWTLSETRTGITGGECLQGAADSTIGMTGTDTINITQAGPSLTAVTTAQANGVSCNWTGTADTDRFVLNLASCQNNANQFNLRCTNGALRDLRVASAVITAVIKPDFTYTGTKAEIYNVTNAGTLTQVGTMTFNENVSMTK
jgi:hypothetical protein